MTEQDWFGIFFISLFFAWWPFAIWVAAKAARAHAKEQAEIAQQEFEERSAAWRASLNGLPVYKGAIVFPPLEGGEEERIDVGV